MAKTEFEIAIENVNEWAAAAIRDEDQKLARDLKKASDFLMANYNKLADKDNAVNKSVMTQYNVMVKCAMRNSDERAARARKEHMAVVEAMLDRKNIIK